MDELTPYICVADSRAAIGWYAKVFGAEPVVEPIVMDDGRVGHAEVRIGNARLMMSDEFAQAGVAPPDPSHGADVTLHLAVAEVDRLVGRACDEGARVDRPAEDTPHGRIAVVTDPFGHRWMLNQL